MVLLLLRKRLLLRSSDPKWREQEQRIQYKKPQTWPKGEISYKWSPDLKPLSEDILYDTSNPFAKAFIHYGQAIQKWESQTCVRFNHDQTNGKVELVAAGASATTGNGKACTTVRARKDDNTPSTFKHELGHWYDL